MVTDMNAGWIGVDLDGTLAVYTKWVDEYHIGEPVPAMLDRVREWTAQGIEVRIFTARVARPDPEKAARTIQEWLVKHLGYPLTVTNVKDRKMIELWDDRAVQVRVNTGEPVGYQMRRVE